MKGAYISMELWIRTWQVSCLALMMLDVVLAQIRYTIPEELEHGAFVGNIAEDLGLDTSKLSIRRFRIIVVQAEDAGFPPLRANVT
uniref:Cadherin N-terminal domain-containing protein n=1 Tax=Sinocyclocheilus anshuiensis TaxID=1608454 RepID=A0A671QE32_9TELE